MLHIRLFYLYRHLAMVPKTFGLKQGRIRTENHKKKEEISMNKFEVA